MAKRQVKKSKTKKVNIVPKDKLLARLSVFFFDRPLITAILWIVLTLFGAISYGSLMKREGFPSVNVPFALVNGIYFVNDPSKVDAEVAAPISEIALSQDGVKNVETTSAANFFNVAVNYEEGTDSKQATEKLEQAIKESGRLPERAQTKFNVPYFGATGGDVDKLDLAISFFADTDNVEINSLAEKAEEAANWLKDKNIEGVEDVFVKQPFEETLNPATNQLITVQRSFDRFGERQTDNTRYRKSVIIGVSAQEDPDIIELDSKVSEALKELQSQDAFAGYKAEISASFAPSIEEQISELQKSLLEGLLAVLIVGSLVIAVRASIITVISMISVVAMTLGFLHLIGYSLNVITLFSLILALALIVDDTIIMVEAIDAARHRHKDRRKAVLEAARKVSRAMVAATLTAALSFAPLLFVSGILGNFIRAIPITVISSLIISLIVALVFIPFFARYILLGKKQMGKKGVIEVGSGLEAKIADYVTRPMIWARHSTRKLLLVGGIAVTIGVSFLIAGLIIARDVPFNIFPPTKDTNELVASLSFPSGTSIASAEETAARADSIIAETLGDNFLHGSYFNTGSEQSASQRIEIISYHDREKSSSQLAKETEDRLTEAGINASVAQLDIGPPAANFVVEIDADNRQAAFALAEDIQQFMESTPLKRQNGTEARFEDVVISSQDQFIRDQGRPVIKVTAGFDADDTSALVITAESSVKERFNEEVVDSYGLNSDAINIDLGQEADNQQSFAALAIAFPVLLLVMYILLAVQFRSLLQPLLIFLAIPFSVFGIALGLKLTDNVFSFFAMLGFFALLGLSIKNTILLTDYANQAHKNGMGAVDSTVEALRERFRPLFATSATAIVSLIPLAITSPFWEGLMVVLIFGLISSTVLVITVFPYYYLGAEYIRLHVDKKQFLIWFIPTIAFVVIVGAIVSPLWGLVVLPISLLSIPLQKFYLRRLS